MLQRRQRAGWTLFQLQISDPEHLDPQSGAADPWSETNALRSRAADLWRETTVPPSEVTALWHGATAPKSETTVPTTKAAALRLSSLQTAAFYRRPFFFFLPRMMSSARFSSSRTVVKV